MKLILNSCFIGLAFLAEIVHGVNHGHLRNRRRTREYTHKQQQHIFEAVPVGTPVEDPKAILGEDSHQRRLNNGGGQYIVSHMDEEGVEWCLDAIEGAFARDKTYLPSVGIRPCAFNSGPTEQLFFPSFQSEGNGVGKIISAFDWHTCLRVANDDAKRVNLGPCDSPLSEFIIEANATSDYVGISEVGEIRYAGNTSRCVTYQENNLTDDDYIGLDDCEETSKFQFSFRTGYYYLYTNGCVAVENQNATDGDRVVSANCSDAGFSAHWRMDGDGLFHTRLDDAYCMEAVEVEDKAPIRMRICNKQNDKQRFTWPSGFEGPICLQTHSDLCIGPQGQTEETSNGNMLLRAREDAEAEFSGDAVH